VKFQVEARTFAFSPLKTRSAGVGKDRDTGFAWWENIFDGAVNKVGKAKDQGVSLSISLSPSPLLIVTYSPQIPI
jgi:hypothetical protein